MVKYQKLFLDCQKRRSDGDFTVSFQHCTGNPTSNNEQNIHQRAWNLILVSTLLIQEDEWLQETLPMYLFRRAS